MLKRSLALVILCLFLSGCMASLSGLPASQEGIEKLRANAAILVKTSPIQIAYLKAALGTDLAKLPNEAITCLDEIVAICAKPELSDVDSCRVAGLWDRIIVLCSPQMLQQVIMVLGQLR